MKVLITDDEAPARTRLRALLSEIEGVEIIGEAANGKEALTQCHGLEPDIILLDIRMPGMDGLEAAMHLSTLENSPAIIFTTAYGDHALSAFEANAVDYLLKPIRKQRLVKALEKTQKLNRVQLQAVEDSEGAQRARTHICVQTYESIELVAIPDIIYFLADQKYVSVRHTGGEMLIEESLVALEKEFADTFTRIHRNALISNTYLKGIEKTPNGEHHVILDGIDDRPTISRRHVPSIRKKLKEIGK